MDKGKINVQTENIFPIIKKFLYSDHEIFLRELVSNAVDATQKLKALSSMGEAKGELGNLTIEVKVDKADKTIRIIDKGIGMTSEEVLKYINEIAFSGAEEFVNKYKDQAANNPLIGHFGLGFYSSFMVAERVEVRTKSYKEGSQAVSWECDGSPEYTMKDIDDKERGTELILHVAADSEDFLESHKIQSILQKYCKFLPVEIAFETEKVKEKDADDKEIEIEKPRIINNPIPAWTKKPADLKAEDYISFYNELYPFAEEPLFWIHLNVDYPFKLTGILYFPKVKTNFEVQKNKIQLYCNQVFVTDSIEGIVPDFMTLLHGVLDSPDIPLNVSRSYLQSDSNVKKISSHITKKVADKLEELFKNNREDFEKKWDDIKIFIEYGMVTEEKFNERALKFCLLKNTEGKFFTTDEYAEKIKLLQKNKEEELVHIYCSDKIEQHSFIESANERGYDVLILDGPISGHYINAMERHLTKVKFKRVDSEVVDKLINDESIETSLLSEDQKTQLKTSIEKFAVKEKFTVVFENLSATDQPILITQPEFMRRMKEMSKHEQGGMFGFTPDFYNLVVNANHPLFSKVLSNTDVDRQDKLVKQAFDLALLAQNMLKGEDLTKFVKRSVELID